MDEMKIESRFMTGLISKIVSMVLRSKLGCDMGIQLTRREPL